MKGRRKDQKKESERKREGDQKRAITTPLFYLLKKVKSVLQSKTERRKIEGQQKGCLEPFSGLSIFARSATQKRKGRFQR